MSRCGGPGPSFLILIVLAGVAPGAAGPAAEARYEPAGKVPAARFLPADALAGPEWQVAPEAENDGAINTYLVRSRFGDFEARGRAKVAARAREVAALVELERVSKSEVFVDAVKSSALGSVETVKQFAAKPVETVKAVPEAVGRWFSKTRFRVEEGYDEVKDAKRERQEGKASAASGDAEAATTAKAAQRDEVQDQAKELARKEALDYLKISGAERRWYAELGVDPYTDNKVLREVVKSYSRVEGLTRFGMKFAGIPGIPGAREMREVMNLVWQTDPWELRQRNRNALMAAGIAEETARAFEDNPYLTLTEQTAILAALEQMAGVRGRQHLIARAIDLESKDGGLALFHATLLLAAHHQDQRPLAEILPGARLPVARSADGRLVAVLPADALFWTEPVGVAASGFAEIYRDDPAKARELWVPGPASERFKAEMQARGWQVRDRWQPASTAKQRTP